MKKILLTLFACLSILQVSAQCWKQLDAGGFFTVGIKDDGTIWGWGRSFTGELSEPGEDFYTAIPMQIGTDSDWASISAGNGHVMALKTDGTLWTWGRNDAGQLGNGEISIYSNEVPSQVGTDNDWSFISAGNVHSAALKNNGTLWTWGSNASGQLGNGLFDVDIAQTIVPTQVGSNTDWFTVCAASDNTAAIQTNGTLWIAGEGNHGEIGNGLYDDQAGFTQVGSDQWKQISFGGMAATAIKTDGTLWSWGENVSGGLGNGTYTNSAVPVQISTDIWKSVTRGMGYFAGAIKSDGSLWTWGYNYFGAVGDGTTIDKNTPILINQGTEWKTYIGGGTYSVGLTLDGELMVWGYNFDNTLGFDLEGDTVLIPVKVEDCITAGDVIHAKGQFAIYPNPATTFLNLVVPDNTSIINIKINDVTGKTVVAQTGHTNQINVQQLPAGLYFIEIKTDTGISHQKFIKE